MPEICILEVYKADKWADFYDDPYLLNSISKWTTVTHNELEELKEWVKTRTLFDRRRKLYKSIVILVKPDMSNKSIEDFKRMMKEEEEERKERKVAAKKAADTRKKREKERKKAQYDKLKKEFDDDDEDED